jgi:folylpolyglutamate synthase/dihydropteroate synthase
MSDEQTPNKSKSAVKNNLPGLVLGVLLGAGGVTATTEPTVVVNEVPREPTVVENVAKTIFIEAQKRSGKDVQTAEKKWDETPSTKIALGVVAETAIQDTKDRPYMAAENAELAVRRARIETKRREDDLYNEELIKAHQEGRMPRKPGEFLDGASNPPSGAPPKWSSPKIIRRNPTE